MPSAPTASAPVSLSSHPLVDAARRVAADVLAPVAEATDRADVVPRSHLDALAAAGLDGMFGPPGVPPAAGREIFEVLAGACGVTFFVWVQHHAPVRLLVRSANASLRARHLDDLCAGRVLGGVAFAYLRRRGVRPWSPDRPRAATASTARRHG